MRKREMDGQAMSACRMIERGSHKCDERRRARILTYAPSFGRHGSKAYLDRLVKQTVEGNAWHAGSSALLQTHTLHTPMVSNAWHAGRSALLQLQTLYFLWLAMSGMCFSPYPAAEIFLLTISPQFAVYGMLVISTL